MVCFFCYLIYKSFVFAGLGKVSQTILFFFCKNLVVILVELYRITSLCFDAGNEISEYAEYKRRELELLALLERQARQHQRRRSHISDEGDCTNFDENSEAIVVTRNDGAADDYTKDRDDATEIKSQLTKCFRSSTSFQSSHAPAKKSKFRMTKLNEIDMIMAIDGDLPKSVKKQIKSSSKTAHDAQDGERIKLCLKNPTESLSKLPLKILDEKHLERPFKQISKRKRSLQKKYSDDKQLYFFIENEKQARKTIDIGKADGQRLKGILRSLVYSKPSVLGSLLRRKSRNASFVADIHPQRQAKLAPKFKPHEVKSGSHLSKFDSSNSEFPFTNVVKSYSLSQWDADGSIDNENEEYYSSHGSDLNTHTDANVSHKHFNTGSPQWQPSNRRSAASLFGPRDNFFEHLQSPSPFCNESELDDSFFNQSWHQHKHDPYKSYYFQLHEDKSSELPNKNTKKKQTVKSWWTVEKDGRYPIRIVRKTTYFTPEEFEQRKSQLKELKRIRELIKRKNEEFRFQL